MQRLRTNNFGRGTAVLAAMALLAGAGAAQDVKSAVPEGALPSMGSQVDQPGMLPALPGSRAVAPAPKPAKRAVKKKAGRRKKSPPINAAYTRGLYTVEKQGAG